MVQKVRITLHEKRAKRIISGNYRYRITGNTTHSRTWDYFQATDHNLLLNCCFIQDDFVTLPCDGVLTYSWPPFRAEFINRLINKLIYSLCGEPHNLEVPGSSPGWSTSEYQQLRSSLSCWYFLFIDKVRRLQNACFSIFFISLFSASLLHETAINHDRICRVVPWPAWSWAIVSLQLRIFIAERRRQ